MRRLIACCVLSAVAGGTIAAWLVDREPPTWPESPAVAQDLIAPPSMLPPGNSFGTAPDGFAANASTAGQANAGLTLEATQSAVSPELTSEERTNIRVYEGANRGVVNILTRTVSYDRFFMLPSPGEGAGSGSVIDTRGHILTNNHVVEGAQAIQVTLPSGKTYTAELIGADRTQDIAVLKIDAPAEELFPVPIGKSDNLRVGQRVYTLGNPFGLEGTLTTGIVSNLNRTLPSRVDGREMKSIIQTDAPMNPGNSGGPLLDTSGRMIGMNVAIATKTGQSAGLGFAIPVNRIRQIVPELIQYGKVVRPDIGIVAVMETDKGLQIVELNRGGPAEKAGLRGWQSAPKGRMQRGFSQRQNRALADVIVAVEGEPIESAATFMDKIDQKRPGDQLVLTVLREGKPLQVTITLGSL